MNIRFVSVLTTYTLTLPPLAVFILEYKCVFHCGDEIRTYLWIRLRKCQRLTSALRIFCPWAPRPIQLSVSRTRGRSTTTIKCTPRQSCASFIHQLSYETRFLRSTLMSATQLMLVFQAVHASKLCINYSFLSY